MKARNILVVDDEKPVIAAITEYLPDVEIHSVAGTHGAVAAFKVLSDTGHRPDAVIIDIYLDARRNQDGLNLIRQFRESYGNDFGIIIITGHPTIELQSRAIDLGADVFITKPLTADKLCAAVGQATGEAEVRGAVTMLLLDVERFISAVVRELPARAKEGQRLLKMIKRFR